MAEATVRIARGGAGKKKQPPDADYTKNARKTRARETEEGTETLNYNGGVTRSV